MVRQHKLRSSSPRLDFVIPVCIHTILRILSFINWCFKLVHIYDATKEQEFEFNESTIGRIQSLPLYAGGDTDLPSNSVAMVAFSANTYTYKGQNADFVQQGLSAISFNVQFVVYLGQINCSKMDDMLAAMGK